MKLKAVEDFFGNGGKACDAVGINRCQFSRWWKNGDVVPAKYAVYFHIVSNGELEIDHRDYEEFWKSGRLY